MQGPRPEGHALNGACWQRPVRPADVVLMSEASFYDVSEPFDVFVGVEGPDRARDQAVVVEDAHRAKAVVFRVAVFVEREVPASAKPATLDVVDFVVSSDFDHWSYPSCRRAISTVPPLLPARPPCTHNAGQARGSRRAGGGGVGDVFLNEPSSHPHDFSTECLQRLFDLRVSRMAGILERLP